MKIVRRVLLGLLLVVVFGVVLLVGSVAADYVLGAGRIDRISARFIKVKKAVIGALQIMQQTIVG